MYESEKVSHIICLILPVIMHVSQRKYQIAATTSSEANPAIVTQGPHTLLFGGTKNPTIGKKGGDCDDYYILRFIPVLYFRCIPCWSLL